MGAAQSTDGSRTRKTRRKVSTSRSRLLLDQRTPAEREISYEAKKTRRNRSLAIILGAILILGVVAVIVFFLYFYEDLMGDSSDTSWSLQNNIKLPDGFRIEEYVRGNDINLILKPRSLHVSTYGDATIVYVGSSTPFVYGLIDYNSDGSNEQTFLLFESQSGTMVHSIAVKETVNPPTETLYIDDQDGNIWQCPDVHQQVLSLERQEDRLNCSIWMSGIPLPNTDDMYDHYMGINPLDNNLCIAFGIPPPIKEPTDSIEGTIRCFIGYDAEIFSINDTIVYAKGVRNSVGFEFHPYIENELWFTDSSADNIYEFLNDVPDDELNNVTLPSQNSKHFGFPYCHTQGFGPIDQRNPGQRANFPDKLLGEKINDTCYEDEYFPAYQPLGLRVDALGMKFVFVDQERNDGLPTKFILIAQHGSNTQLIGYSGFRVMMVEFVDQERNDRFQNIISAYQPFAEGWFDDDTQQFYGRPVDVEWLRKPGPGNNDNGFIVSDDYANVIYRIYYDNQEDVIE